MTEIERSEVQSKIVEALRKLIPNEDQRPLGEMWIEYGIGGIMAYIDAINGDLDLNWRTPLGRNKVKKELNEIASLYEKLIVKMNAVHGPTHGILSTIGIGPFFEKTRCENILSKIQDIDVSFLPVNPGRGQTKMRERYIADRLAITYANITGSKPSRAYDWLDSRAYGKFLELVVEVFEIASINASAEDCARHAVEGYAARDGEKGG